MLVRKRLFHSFFGCATLALGLLVAPGSESVGRADPPKYPSVPPKTGEPKKENRQPVVIKGKPKVPKTLGKAGVIVDAGNRVYDSVETEKAYSAGEITQEDREVAHAKNAVGMAGGLGGAAGGATTAAWVGAPIAAMTGPAAPFVEGGFLLAGGVVGYAAGEKAVSYVAEQGVRAIHRTGNTISSSATATWNTTTSPVRRAWSWCWGQ